MYYHDLRDVPELLDPEIMEDVAKFLFLGIAGVTSRCDNPINTKQPENLQAVFNYFQ